MKYKIIVVILGILVFTGSSILAQNIYVDINNGNERGAGLFIK